MPYVNVRKRDYQIAISVPKTIRRKIEEIAREKGYSSLSQFVKEILIREIEKYEKSKNSRITSYISK